ncbi:MAG: hypothetical protein DRM98_04230 [Thermoplasmata archaeon]|nr:MAG: hypothetical protein FE039_01720 [Thermoplasmata archaeon]RLF32240.1 MAG: hypothetical protein DRM98_04230 [Thermoplasmata archaeon]RLF36884.1 MAG: hypothetical protein DRM99_01760 [Thermoplasmata archaeon]RLF53034.1 MAG: hypothetical protein DRN24_02230 [Thermoplasmata archaeon]
MKVLCDVVIDLGDKVKVENVLRSVKVDDFDFVDSRVEGDCLVAHMEADSVSSLLHTLDDYLSCVSVAMKVLG